MIKIQFNALTEKQRKRFLIIAAASTIISPLLFVFILIYNKVELPVNLRIRVLIFAVFAVIIWIVFSFLIKKIIPSKKYTLTFDHTRITVTSDVSHIISYDDLETIVITNNSNYSSVKLKQTNGDGLQLYVGLATLPLDKPILKSDDMLDSVLLESFTKDISMNKSIKVFTFTKKQ